MKIQETLPEPIRKKICPACGSNNAMYDNYASRIWHCEDCGAGNHYYATEF